MDKEKARLIFDKMKEIKEIVETEPNCRYFLAFFDGDYMYFNNSLDEENSYSYALINGEIERT